MRTLRNIGSLFVLSVLVSVVLTGCSSQTATPTTQPVPSSNAAADWKAGLDEKVIEGLSELADADRTAALAQKTCPVAGGPLGAMGMPPKVTVEGRDVFLCCAGCEDKLRANPQEYFSKLDKP